MDKSKWEYKKLGEVCTFISGLWVGKKPPYKEVGVIRNANFTKECQLRTDNIAVIEVEEKQFDKKKLKKGDIIIEKSGGSDKQPVGRPVLFNLDGEYSFSNFTSALRIKEVVKLDPKFLHKCLASYYFAGATKAMQSKTTGLHNLDLKMYKNQLIPIIPISIQQSIVSELDQLSAIISLKQQQMKEYDALAQSLFYEMINNATSIDKKKLKDICEYSKGRYDASKLTVDNYVGVENLLKNCQGKRQASTLGKILSATAYKKGDVLIGNIRPYLRKIWLATNDGGASGDVLVIRINNEYTNKIDPLFLYSALAQDDFFIYDNTHTKGVKMPRGDKKEIMNYSIPLPPLSLQRSFAEKVKAIEHQKSLLKQSIAETQTLLDSRMQEYFG